MYKVKNILERINRLDIAEEFEDIKMKHTEKKESLRKSRTMLSGLIYV